MPLTKATCRLVFSGRDVDEEAKTKLLSIRQAGEDFAHVILDLCPNSADKTTALRSVREAMLWAMEAIILRGEV